MIADPGADMAAEKELDDEDAEGEFEGDDSSSNPGKQSDPDEDAEGEEDVHGQDEEDGEDEDGGKYHGAVKVPEPEQLESDAEGNDDSSEGDSDVESDSGSSEASSAESNVENDWEADHSADDEGGTADIAARNDCIFCGEGEENDPSEEYEEYLACAVCGDNAHRQCAREKDSFSDDLNDASRWKCPQCTENGFEADSVADKVDELELPEDKDAEDLSIQRRLSASSSRLTRDLLPAARGTPKPGAHSIFNNPILADDPADGSRALRKRKSSEAIDDAPSRASSKRPRTSDSRQEKTPAPAPPSRGGRSSTTTSRTRRTPANPGEVKEDHADTNGLAAGRAQRPRRPKKEVTTLAKVIRKTKSSLVLSMKVDTSGINFRPPKRKRGPGRRRSSYTVSSAPIRAMTPYTTPYYAFHDRDNDGSKKPPYGGILNEEEADTSATMPTAEDRAKFETARQRAEEEWKKRSAAADAEQEVKGRASQKVSGPPSKIKSIIFGRHEIDTWYAAPYPEEYSRNRVLFICEFCLKYMGSDFVAWRHKLKCPCRYPPGDEIYRDGSISIFEVDGRKNPAYCQNLCLLAKLFLGSKTLYYDVEPFLFYIMTEYDQHGYHFVGYFSKEKRPSSMNNVSCILTMPHHQRKGYGNLLIDFSYLLTRKEERTGSPEKPLSDMGLVSYRNYWRLQLCYHLIKADPSTDSMSVKSISEALGMTPDDVISQLEALRVLVRDPVTKTYAFRLDKAYFKETIEKWEVKGYSRLNADRLVWTPYIMSRTSNLALFDRPPISTVAPREDEEDEDEDIAPEEGVQQQLQAEKQDAEAEANNANGVATSDFAASASGDIRDVPMQEVPEMALSSPAKPPALPLVNGLITAAVEAPPQSPVPAWRYELWPPVPGTIYRSRRGGYRPKGSRVTVHGTIFNGSPSVPAATPRGSRTSLRQSANKATNGIGGDGRGKGKGKGAEAAIITGKAEDRSSPSARRSTRSRMGTPGADSISAGLDGSVDDDEPDAKHELAGRDGDDDDDEESTDEAYEPAVDEDPEEPEEPEEAEEDAEGDADDDYQDAGEDIEGDEDEEDVAMEDDED